MSSLKINSKLNKINIKTGEIYETGRIIDGKIEYGKRINIGNLPPTSGNYDYPTGLNHSDIIYTDYNLVARRPSDNSTLYIPFSPGTGVWIVSFPGNQNAFRVNTNGDPVDRSAYIGILEVTFIYK